MFLPSDPVIDSLLKGSVLAAIALLWVVVLIRGNGLRSLSKMTNFDFVMTIALGSLVAGAAQADEWLTVLQIGAGMLALFAVQNITSRLRKMSDTVEDIMQNDPIILMKDGEICEAALKKTRVARSDLVAKLREANALDWTKVHAVVLETTGDISVLHGDGEVDKRLVQDLRDPA